MAEVVEPRIVDTDQTYKPQFGLRQATETMSLCHRGTAKSREQVRKKDAR